MLRPENLWWAVILTTAMSAGVGYAFVTGSTTTQRGLVTQVASTTTSVEDDIAIQKKKLLELLQPQPQMDAVLADPVTKEPLCITPTNTGTILGGQTRAPKVKYTLQATSENATLYQGDSYSYINLLEPAEKTDTSDDQQRLRNDIVKRLTPFVPPPLRVVMSASGVLGDEYVPMRDLFTSPAVSYAYERGWRQGFAQAGFPGPDQEAKMAMEYFAPVMNDNKNNSTRVLVDMSCATGLFTRRFTKSGNYRRVLGCDYSDSMLEEARKRINSDAELSGPRKSTATQLDLIRLDVGQIPMQTESIDALHAGAAMHCWPDLPTAVQEIHRVLKPGGRYFATTFLSSYFRILQGNALGGTADSAPSSQAFQYFESVEVLRDLLVQDGGFAKEKVLIEVLGNACVVIRAEK